MLDTDICITILREKSPEAKAFLFKTDPASLCISVITEAELLYGVAKSQHKKANRKVVDDFLERIVVMEWDSDAAACYAELRALLEAKGKMIGNMDMLIAAHALSLNAALVTNNIKHFQQVPKLRLEKWI